VESYLYPPLRICVACYGGNSRSLDARVVHHSHDVAEDTTDVLQLRISYAREAHGNDLVSSAFVCSWPVLLLRR